MTYSTFCTKIATLKEFARTEWTNMTPSEQRRLEKRITLFVKKTLKDFEHVRMKRRREHVNDTA